MVCLTIFTISCSKSSVPAGKNCEVFFEKGFKLLADPILAPQNKGIYVNEMRTTFASNKEDSGLAINFAYRDGKVILMVNFLHTDNSICLAGGSPLALGYSPEEMYILKGRHRKNCVYENSNDLFKQYALGLYELPINSVLFKQLLLKGSPIFASIDTKSDVYSFKLMDNDTSSLLSNTARCIYETELGEQIDVNSNDLLDNNINTFDHSKY